jgi:hypothetical protein
MQNTATTADIFLHVRVVMGIVVGLSIARLVYFVQNPGKKRVYFVHIGWTMFMLPMLVHFRW